MEWTEYLSIGILTNSKRSTSRKLYNSSFRLIRNERASYEFTNSDNGIAHFRIIIFSIEKNQC